VSPTGLRSGAEVVLRDYLTAAVRAGWRVECLRPAGPFDDELRSVAMPGGRIAEQKLPAGPSAAAIPRLFVNVVRASRRIRQAAARADVVVVNGVFGLLAARMARTGRPVVWIVHDATIRPLITPFVGLGLPVVRRAIAVSETAAAVPRSFGIPTTVVMNGAPTHVAGPDTGGAPPVEAETPIVGINAALTPWKGHRVFLTAMAAVPEATIEVMGGPFPKDGAHVAGLRTLVDELGMTARVRFLGHVPDPAAVMRRWSVAVNASVEPEAAPLSVLEAMSLGVAVVATDHGGSAELLGHGAYGVLVPVGDPGAMAGAVRSLLADEERRRLVADAGQRRARSAHRIDDAARRFLETLRAEIGPVPPLRTMFVNENIGGHATVHFHLERILHDRTDVEAVFHHVPAPGPVRRILSAPIPGLARFDLDGQSLRAQLLASAVTARAVRRRLGERDVDVLHLYSHNIGLRMLGLVRRVPTVVTTDSSNALNAYRNPYRRPTRFTPWTVAASKPFERRLVGAATLLVANSHWVADSWRGDYGIDAHRVRVLPFGVDAPAFPDGAAPGTTAERPTLVFVGRHLDRKGGLQLHRVHQRRFADRADLLYITPDRVPPGRAVRVIGDITTGDQRLWTHLRASSVFVFPSEIDQSPNAVLEAMAAGLPVIAARVGAVPELVPEGICGLLVHPGDDDELAAAITALLDDPDRRVRMGAAAQAHQRAHFDMRNSVEDLVVLLDEASRRGAGPR
jgi:glycosyltransferase involved in cell wall biosynthesis